MAVPLSTKRITDEVVYVKSHAPAADTEATETIGVGAGQFAIVWRIWAAFATAPGTDEVLTTTGLVSDGDTSVGQLKVTIRSAGVFEFIGPFYGAIGTDVKIALSAAANTSAGSVNFLYSLHPAHQQA